MTTVACVLADHVDIDSTQVHLGTHEWTYFLQVASCAVSAGVGNFCLPDRQPAFRDTLPGGASQTMWHCQTLSAD
jgi:hypothetical protein